MSYVVEIGKNIAGLRKARRISQEVLAFDSNISVSSLRDIEHGRANPSIDTLESLARTLGLTLPELLIYQMAPDEVSRLLMEAVVSC